MGDEAGQSRKRAEANKKLKLGSLKIYLGTGSFTTNMLILIT